MLKIHCKGVVQGVGFRPFVCNLANDLGVRGSVINVGGDGIIYLDLPYVWDLGGDVAHKKSQKFVRFFALDLQGVIFANAIFAPNPKRHQNPQKPQKPNKPQNLKKSQNLQNLKPPQNLKSPQNQASDFGAFFSAFFATLPPNAKIHSIKISYISAKKYDEIFKHNKNNLGFVILDSALSFLELDSSIPQDLATCQKCLADIFAPKSRHFLYYLISCTNCGGRYSLIKSMPYDRANTAMSAYKMCEKCAKDYTDTKNRFYHAQPISCNDCAVPIALYSRGKILEGHQNVFEKVAFFLESGEILCIKGLGGFALICDSTNAKAIKTLRERKNRATKPFAIMAKDIFSAQKIAKLNSAESSALCDKSAPIVLARQDKTNALGLALEQIAPNLSTIGILLANTALHHILFRFFDKPIIYTSANLKGEPIITDLAQAQSKLESITEYFLDFEREIYNGIDDSILRFIAGEMRPIRLARGKTPHNFMLNFTSQNQSKSTQKAPQKYMQPKKKILAFGAQDKTTLCYASKDNLASAKCMLSPYVGDLSSVATQEKYLNTMEFFMRIYDFSPNVIVSDFHPRYESVKLAKQMQENLAHQETKHLQIYHHHAHLCAILGEVASSADDEILGIIWDGSGLGENGDIWGGEFLFGGFRKCRRVGHLQEFNLYGGEVAIKEIWRVGYALSELCNNAKMQAKYEKYFEQNALLKIALQKGINSYKTTSIGRLFDGVASLMGILQNTRYEGESGALIEELYYQNLDCAKTDFGSLDFGSLDFAPKNALSKSSVPKSSTPKSSTPKSSVDFAEIAPYPFEIKNGLIMLESFIGAICEDIILGVDLGVVARRFIRTLSFIALDFAKEFLRTQASVDFFKNADFGAKSSADFSAQIKVGFSGGVFQNKALCEEIHALFLREKIPHFFHTIVPTNDGGISFGQALFGLCNG